MKMSLWNFLKEGEQVVPDERGRIVFTNLDNFAMPVIRYDIKDIGTYTDESCPCGRGLVTDEVG